MLPPLSFNALPVIAPRFAGLKPNAEKTAFLNYLKGLVPAIPPQPFMRYEKPAIALRVAARAYVLGDCNKKGTAGEEQRIKALSLYVADFFRSRGKSPSRANELPFRMMTVAEVANLPNTRTRLSTNAKARLAPGSGQREIYLGNLRQGNASSVPVIQRKSLAGVSANLIDSAMAVLLKDRLRAKLLSERASQGVNEGELPVFKIMPWLKQQRFKPDERKRLQRETNQLSEPEVRRFRVFFNNLVSPDPEEVGLGYLNPRTKMPYALRRIR